MLKLLLATEAKDEPSGTPEVVLHLVPIVRAQVLSLDYPQGEPRVVAELPIHSAAESKRRDGVREARGVAVAGAPKP